MRGQGNFFLGACPKEEQLDQHQLTVLVRKRYLSSSATATVVVRRSPRIEDAGNTRTRMEEFDSHLKKITISAKIAS